MRGSMLIFEPGKLAEHREFDRALTLEELRTAVGGDIEHVQGFETVNFGGAWISCVAFCNEHGKLDHLPINNAATMAYERAVRRLGGTLRAPDSTFIEWLAGPVAVIFGDAEFMAEL
jgi:hypothetical protein